MEEKHIPLEIDSAEDQSGVRLPLSRYFNKQQIYANSQREYSLSTLVLIFFAISVIGWLFEVALYVVDSGVLLNPGVLHGPWLPIYGTGGILALVLLKRWRTKPFISFLLVIGVSGSVEYITGRTLELLTGARWWDYSNFTFNIGGYLCLEALLAFGIFGIALIYVLAPALASQIEKISDRTRKVLIATLLLVFIADVSVSLINPNSMASNYAPQNAKVAFAATMIEHPAQKIDLDSIG